MTVEELKLPVTIRLSTATGLFLVSEPDNERSICSRNRREIEQKLSNYIKNLEEQKKNKTQETPNLKLNDMVAVKLMDDKHWLRGLIKNKVYYRSGSKWSILLLDWGSIIETTNEDILPLPLCFSFQPCYSQFAVLAGIVPVRNSFNKDEPPEYDGETRNFIEKIFGASPESKMTAVGVDRARRLHIRLYLKFPSRGEYFCLNDTLCDKQFAQKSTEEELEPLLFDALFWESFPPLPFQPPPPELQSGDVGMRDYANEYQRIRRAKEEAATALGRDTSSSSLSTTSEKSRGRGVMLFRDKISAESKRPASSLSSASSAGSRGRGAALLRELLGTQASEKRESLLDSSFDSVNAGSLTDSSSSASGVKIGFTRYKYDKETVALGRASTRLCPVQSEQPPEPQVGAHSNELSPNVHKPEEKPGRRRISFRPGGMAVPVPPPRWTRSYIPPEPRSLTDHLGARPRTGRFPFQNSRPQGVLQSQPTVGSVSNQQVNYVQQKTWSTPQEPTESRSIVQLEAAFKPKTQVERLLEVKIPEEKMQSINQLLELAGSAAKSTAPQQLAEPGEGAEGEKLAQQEPESKRQEESQRKAEEEEEKQQRQLQLQQKLKKIHEQEAQKYQSLEQAKQQPAFQQPGLQQLQPSRIVEMTQQGRILIRSPFEPPAPCFVLNEIPFETPIQEALKIMGIYRPKLIQAHVWEAILRGLDVAYVAGNRTGKTLGYLVPILNNLLDKKSYNLLPKGCSPIVIVICASWQGAEAVHEYCRDLTRRVPDFRSAVLSDGTSRTIKESLSGFINGVTLLAATAPALSYVMDEAKTLINFDRCCHLVFENADSLLQEHGAVMKNLFVKYQESVRRTDKPDASGQPLFVPRQVIACANYWTPGMQLLSEKGMKSTTVYISSCMEAAIYGGMKLDVANGTRAEMDERLVSIVLEKQKLKTVVFCRSKEEVKRLEEKFVDLGVTTLSAHNESLVCDLDFVARRWKQGLAVLLCTDDVVERLNIRDATALIHYYIPQHSKFDFTYRFSLSLDKFSASGSEGGERLESHLLITEEFSNALLTIVRFMQRFGLAVPDELATEAVFSFCNKEMSKRDNMLCPFLKSLGTCRHLKFCSARHIVLKELDSPPPQWPTSGNVRVLITAVHGTTRFYGRLLKYRVGDGNVVDLSTNYFEFYTRMQSVCEQAARPDKSTVQVGNVYAWLNREGSYVRVRVDSVKHFDRDEHAIEVEAVCVDSGDVANISVCELHVLPEDVKTHPPLVAEIFLVGLKPYDGSSTWNRYSMDFVRDKVINKEMDGHIVLALSSTLWLDPLLERKKIGFAKKDWVTTLNIRKDLIDAELAKGNEGHMEKLYHLCVTGGFELPDYSIGLVKKTKASASVSYAFLPRMESTDVCVSCADSPQLFYVRIRKFSDTLSYLEKDIQGAVSKSAKLEEKNIQPGQLCLVRCVLDGNWYRARVRDVGPPEEPDRFSVFFVDYGLRERVPCGNLREMSPWMIERIPFQAIACSLAGIAPLDGIWSEEALEFFESIVQSTNFSNPVVLAAAVVSKDSKPSATTLGSSYSIRMSYGKTNTDLAECLIQQEFALKVDIPHVPDEPVDEFPPVDPSQWLDEEKFDVSDDWVEYMRQSALQNRLEQNSASFVVEAESKPVTQSRKPTPPLILQPNDQDLPVKSPDSRFPIAKWYQNAQHVILTFHLNDVADYRLELERQQLNFLAEVMGVRYEMQVKLFAEIDPDDSGHGVDTKGVRITLKKADDAEWVRLTATSLKLPWLSRDFDAWVKSTDSDDEEPRRPMIDLEYVFGDGQPDSSSSDSDELDDFGDTKWLNDDYLDNY